MSHKYKNSALTIRLIVGIFSILLSVIIGFQSCAASFGEAITKSETAGGAAGIILSFFMLAAGITAVAARKTTGGTITAIAAYALGGIVALANQSAFFQDLKIWTVVSFIFAVLLGISLFMKNKVSNAENSNTEDIETVNGLKFISADTNKTVKRGNAGSVAAGFVFGMLALAIIIDAVLLVVVFNKPDFINRVISSFNGSEAGYKYAEYNDYNSASKTKDKKGDNIYIATTNPEYMCQNGYDYLMCDTDDGKWLVWLNAYSEADLNSISNAVVDNKVRIYGSLMGYSEKESRPALIAERMIIGNRTYSPLNYNFNESSESKLVSESEISAENNSNAESSKS